MLVDLAAPVGQLGDANAQGVHGRSELGLLEVDVAADLMGAASRRARTGRARLGGGLLVAHETLPRVAFVSLASSIAMAGFGGAPFLTSL